ncbi:MAG: hypothetical protein COZ06_23330 [Armatimonadetes bacterium CG_4_10_14_3_um_filter_66_18]|nr:hypothetical protein [Armatimonadota bacterium]OIP06354.1 MAG: hypothetical protein AUJ96_09145 [Armatimonadetes bacterium CG2_30_66_41]PIU89447.1 MAG: hypothetical protein COS65_28540 [Armatimonadetes bacterium CG06_land_8_20_14_3_00_66_21]PIX37822.1 MAG: hypothetical protein COZ57_32365 [Armatimonadetes bacterium CG_4_8_14_3_um_filter_66_20]PIY43233.1 MAG: hypothetical protein COZ06_23330 [Armatimonadetes bacterium CG_4_10_14_3_um_filter_66_18]PIZ34217.1 MAG: hypothetical protein COY42_28
MNERKVHAVSNWQALMLVLLRVAIGWHFLREGMIKLSKPNWSCAEYLQVSTGPLSPAFKALATGGGEALLTVEDIKDLPGLATSLANMDDPLAVRFQEKMHDDTLLMADMVASGSPPHAKLPAKLTADLNSLLKGEVPYTEKTAKLFAKIDLPKALKRQALGNPQGQKRVEVNRRILSAVYPKHLPALKTNKLLPLANFTTKWGLTLVGLGLMLGACTRLAALGGMGFLVLFYLALPPWPETMQGIDTMTQLAHPLWTALRQPGREGNYLFIDKNFVEFLALGVIGAFNTGRMMGLDSVLGPLARRLCPCGKRPKSDGDEPTPAA